MAKRNKGRPVDGVFLLDKPQGMSSNYALQRVKRLYGAAKAGHTGALDPLATGLLPIALGEATKFSQFLLDADKRYITTAKLGIRTNTSDAEGEVVATAEVNPETVTEQAIAALLVSHFSGEIEQVPSMFSALKHQGQPLYKLARQGKQVEVKPRRVTIYSAKLLAFRGDEVDLEIHCSKGTYIRSIVEDLGLLLGCGAHVSMLRRTATGRYQADQMLTLEQLMQLAEPKELDEPQESIQMRLDALLLPAWSAIADLPVVEVSEAQGQRISQGVAQQVATTLTGPVRIEIGGAGVFLGLGEITQEGVLAPRRMLSVSATN